MKPIRYDAKQAANQCTYQFPFETVREFINFSQQIRLSPRLPFPPLPNDPPPDSSNRRIRHPRLHRTPQLTRSRPAPRPNTNSLLPRTNDIPPIRRPLPRSCRLSNGDYAEYDVDDVGAFILSCPAGNPVIEFQNFPALNVVVRFRRSVFPISSYPLHFLLTLSSTQNNPDPTPFINTSTLANNTNPAITHNRSIPLSFPGRLVNLTWELPGQAVGPNSSFVTNTSAGAPQVSFSHVFFHSSSNYANVWNVI